MAKSSILGGERPPLEPKGTGVDSLGPSDSSDSGSDAAGTVDSKDQRAAIEGGIEVPGNADILPDRVGVLPADSADVARAPDEQDPARARDLALDEDDEEGDNGEQSAG